MKPVYKFEMPDKEDAKALSACSERTDLNLTGCGHPNAASALKGVEIHNGIYTLIYNDGSRKMIPADRITIMPVK